MHFIGIDLAWGERNPTGVAVLDETGALTHLATMRTDDEVVDAVQTLPARRRRRRDRRPVGGEQSHR